MQGLPAGHVVDADVTLNEALAMCGNGVVPQQAAAAIRHLLHQQPVTEPAQIVRLG